jgi:hypothetical protein
MVIGPECASEVESCTYPELGVGCAADRELATKVSTDGASRKRHPGVHLLLLMGPFLTPRVIFE